MGKYDAIIVGAGIAGLGVGSLLQDKGLKTAVFEKSKVVGGRSRTFELPGGWRIDMGTHCVDQGIHSSCNKLLQVLGKEIPWSHNLEGFMFYDEDGTWKPMMEYLNLSAGEKQELLDLQKWIGSATDEIIDHYDNVSLTKLLEEKVKSPRIAEFCKTVGMVQTTLTESDIISAGEFIHIYRDQIRVSISPDLPFNAVRMPLGGVATMMAAMEAAYRERGGTLNLGTPIRKVNVRKGEMTEVVTDGGAYSAPIVVIAAPIWNVLRFLSMDEMAQFAPAWAKRMKECEFETSASTGFTIGTRVPLFTDKCYLSAWRVPGVGLPLQILGHTNFDDTIAPPGHMIAFIGACGTPAQIGNAEFRKKTLEQFWEVVKKMFPNVERDLVWRQDGFTIGIDGLSRSPGMTGRYRLPVFLPEVPGLYFAGDCYTGRGVGMNTAASSAMICAGEILARQGK
ncbi:MAG: NAD(P)/FAD-dependent oxidoreductase [Syntrophaceae bacterium]|nr:NAD(P)/FAD-dependent oxidoreductase [Syntrophaceae bacterium]